MSGMWSKLIKTLSSKNAGATASSSQLPPRVPKQSDSGSSPPQSHSSSALPPRPPHRCPPDFPEALAPAEVHPRVFACAICLGNVRNGQGQAIFTAECSHSFHFSCIANSVKHGHYLCPICRCKWKEIPFQMPNLNTTPSRAQVSPDQTPPHAWSNLSSASPGILRYSDDEPLPAVPTDPPSAPPSSFPLSQNNMSVKAIPELPALPAGESSSNFAVLVGVRGPSLSGDARQLQRAPIDLVAVLDVSGSMIGSKLRLLKRAVRFVIDNLGPTDRLSIVSFSSNARRILPLRRMTDGGRGDAKLAVNSLSSDGRGTNIVDGLKMGGQVLEERSERNPVASIFLLSDGIDTYNTNYHHGVQYNHSSSSPTQDLEYLNLLPPSVLTNPGHSNFPVHTFGFGADHDSFALHAISDASGGTFSFIESLGLVQDALARCIGGLLSVVAHELQLMVTSTLGIGSIFSGRYTSEVSEDRLQGVITIGDLYADEEKEFLVYVPVPVCCPITEGLEKTPLLKIACSYRDITKNTVELEGEGVDIRRPETLSPEDTVLSLEVDRQKVRLSVVKAIAEAKEMAELGNLNRAEALLMNTTSALCASSSAQAGDSLCSYLEAELSEIRRRMEDMDTYVHTGRAYVLSGLSSHSSQRPTTRSSSSGPVGYDTPSMVTMVSRSQTLSAEYYHRQQAARLTRSASLTRI
ncbi:hypothetical protein OROGR_002884 [Orobanche gracilis]